MFRGTCNDLKCVTVFNFRGTDSFDCTSPSLPSDNPSHVQFEALKEDVFYYIFVQGENGATEITFNLAVQAESTVPAPLNEECDSTLGATSPFKLSNGVTRLGTTVGTMLAESDEDQVAPNSPCPEGEVAVDTGGVWYEFMGTGTPVEISVCGMADLTPNSVSIVPPTSATR